MEMQLSQTERYSIFVLVDQNDWGGGEDALLTRDRLYDDLDLDEFEDINPKVIRNNALEKLTKPYQITEDVAAALIELVVRQGQSRMLGRCCARVLRRLRVLVPLKPKPPAEPPPATEPPP